MRVTVDVKHATRKRILDASRKLLAAKGFEATTTRDIARAAKIAVGTLFNYFPTKESIVELLLSDACTSAAETFSASVNGDDPVESNVNQAAPGTAEAPSLEEDLFAYVAVILRKLKPYRKYLPAVMETSLSPLGVNDNSDKRSLREAHIETVY